MFKYGFYNSYEHDRQYNAEDFGRMFDGLINDGVFATVGELFATIPGDGLAVVVKSGKAWFNRTWSYNDSFVSLDIPLPDVLLSRIDAVVLEINQNQNYRLNRLAVVQGTPSSNPQRPILANTEELHQYPLAYVTVDPNVTSIDPSKIEIMVGRDPCPFVTGIIETNDITDLYQHWEGEFTNWFENVKAQLTENVVTNLQYQIDQRVKYSDKASVEDMSDPDVDNKWVTPYSLHSSGTMIKIGDIKWGLEKPNGYLPCTGGSYSKTAYPKLASIIGYDVQDYNKIPNVKNSYSDSYLYEGSPSSVKIGNYINVVTGDYYTTFIQINATTGSVVSTKGYFRSVTYYDIFATFPIGSSLYLLFGNQHYTGSGDDAKKVYLIKADGGTWTATGASANLGIIVQYSVTIGYYVIDSYTTAVVIYFLEGSSNSNSTGYIFRCTKDSVTTTALSGFSNGRQWDLVSGSPYIYGNMLISGQYNTYIDLTNLTEHTLLTTGTESIIRNFNSKVKDHSAWFSHIYDNLVPCYFPVYGHDPKYISVNKNSQVLLNNVVTVDFVVMHSYSGVTVENISIKCDLTSIINAGYSTISSLGPFQYSILLSPAKDIYVLVPNNYIEFKNGNTSVRYGAIFVYNKKTNTTTPIFKSFYIQHTYRDLVTYVRDNDLKNILMGIVTTRGSTMGSADSGCGINLGNPNNFVVPNINKYAFIKAQ